MAAHTSLICALCKDFLSDPVNLPCWCTVCKHHLNNKSQITCLACDETFYLPDERIKENTRLKNIIQTGGYGTDDERTFRLNVQKSVRELKELFKQYTLKSTEFDHKHSTRFNQLEREINDRRAKFKNSIDEIADEMLGKLRESKNIYQQQKEFNKPYEDEDFEEFIEKFNNVNIKGAETERLNTELNQNINMLKSKLTEIDEWKVGLQKYSLAYSITCERRALKPIFGFLKHKAKPSENRINQNQNLDQDQNDHSRSALNLFDGSNSLFQNQSDQFFESTSQTRGSGPITSFSNVQFRPQVDSMPDFVFLPQTKVSKSVNKVNVTNEKQRDTQEIVLIKRPRLILTDSQKKILEDLFERNHNPNNNLMEKLAKDMKTSVLAISNWFKRARKNNPNEIGVNKRSERTKLTAKQTQHLNKLFEKCKFPKIPRLARKLKLPQTALCNWFSNKRSKAGIKQNPKEFKREPIYNL